MEIPDYAIERIARCLLPMIQQYYYSPEGQADLAAWKEKKTLKTQETKTAKRCNGKGEAGSNSDLALFFLVLKWFTYYNGFQICFRVAIQD